MRALLCSDGSPSAFEAERVLSAIADRGRVEVTVMGVIPTGVSPLPPLREEFEAEWVPRIEDAAVRLAAAGFSVRGAMTYGHPGASIIRETERGAYELTVIGSGGRSWLGNLLLGSVGRRVLHCSGSSVLVTHRGPVSLDSSLIVVGIDGSPPSMHVVHQLIALLDPSRCRVVVAAFTAGSLLSELPLKPGKGAARIPHAQRSMPLPARAMRDAEQAAAKFDGAGIDVSVVIEEGRPIEGLMHIVAKDRADLVAMGSRGLGLMRRGLLGSVSDQVSRLAPATLVARASQRDMVGDARPLHKRPKAQPREDSMAAKNRIEAYLADRGVAYEGHHHPSAAFTAQEIAALEHIPGKLVAKVVLAFSDERLVMFVVPAPYWVDLEKAAVELGSTLVRLAGEGTFGTYFPDCELGATPPFGNLYGVPVYVDRSLSEERTIYFQAGTHNDVIEMEFEEFLRLADAALVDVARGEAA